MISSGKRIPAKNLFFKCVVYVKMYIQIYDEKFDTKNQTKKINKMKCKIHIQSLQNKTENTGTQIV